MTQYMEDTTDVDAGIRMRIGTTPRGDQQAIAEFTLLTQLRRVVVVVTQDVAHFEGQLTDQRRCWNAVVDIRGVSLAAKGIQTAATVQARCSFQPYHQP